MTGVASISWRGRVAWAIPVCVLGVAGLMACSADPADPADPADHADPGDPADPADPADPDCTLVTCNRDDGETATWTVRDPTAVSEDSTTLALDVVRLGCASGVTGEVLPADVTYLQDRIVIRIDVAPSPAGQGIVNCQGNDAVPVTLELTEPIEGRELVDAACLEGEAVNTSFCESEVRWPA